MSIYYNQQLMIAPFLIAPNALTNQEYSTIFMPRGMNLSEVVNKLYAPIAENNITSLIVTRVIRFHSKLLYAVIIQTKVLDRDSNRLGLKLTYDALIDYRVIREYPDIFLNIHELFSLFFENLLGRKFDLDTANLLVAKYQEKDFSEGAMFTSEIINSFLKKFEGDFEQIKNNTRSQIFFGTIIKLLASLKFSNKGITILSNSMSELLEEIRSLGKILLPDALRKNESDRKHQIDLQGNVWGNSLPTDNLLLYLVEQWVFDKLSISFVLLTIIISLFRVDYYSGSSSDLPESSIFEFQIEHISILLLCAFTLLWHTIRSFFTINTVLKIISSNHKPGKFLTRSLVVRRISISLLIILVIGTGTYLLFLFR